MLKNKQELIITLCAGSYDLMTLKDDCKVCKHYARVIGERGYWMIPPEFDKNCPDKIESNP